MTALMRGLNSSWASRAKPVSSTGVTSLANTNKANRWRRIYVFGQYHFSDPSLSDYLARRSVAAVGAIMTRYRWSWPNWRQRSLLQLPHFALQREMTTEAVLRILLAC